MADRKGSTGKSGMNVDTALVRELAESLPRVKTFATLSPIPGFGSWLRGGGRHLGQHRDKVVVRCRG